MHSPRLSVSQTVHSVFRAAEEHGLLSAQFDRIQQIPSQGPLRVTGATTRSFVEESLETACHVVHALRELVDDIQNLAFCDTDSPLDHRVLDAVSGCVHNAEEIAAAVDVVWVEMRKTKVCFLTQS